MIGWLADTSTPSNHSASTADRREGTLYHRSHQTAMSDHANREEVVRRVEAKLKAARERGEFGRKKATEEKILSIARNTCGKKLE